MCERRNTNGQRGGDKPIFCGKKCLKINKIKLDKKWGDPLVFFSIISPNLKKDKNMRAKVTRFTALFAIGILVVGTPAIQSICPSVSAADQKIESLNNASVIEMQSLNLGDGVIVDKIRSSRCEFDVTLSGLKQLKDAKVSDIVIQAMIGTKIAVADSENRQPPVGDINDPNTYHDSGVWLYEEIGGAGKMTQLSTEAFDVSKMDVVTPSPFVRIRNSAIVFPDVAAKIQSSSRRPIFYMYLGEGRRDNRDIMQTLTPDQLTLAHLKVTDNKKKQERTISIASGGAFGGHFGLPAKERRRFDWSKVGLGIYKATPQEDLSDGEYAFFYSHFQSEPGNMRASRVFTFGIHLK
jgi:hypothetical protein